MGLRNVPHFCASPNQGARVSKFDSKSKSKSNLEAWPSITITRTCPKKHLEPGSMKFRFRHRISGAQPWKTLAFSELQKNPGRRPHLRAETRPRASPPNAQAPRETRPHMPSKCPCPARSTPSPRSGLFVTNPGNPKPDALAP